MNNPVNNLNRVEFDRLRNQYPEGYRQLANRLSTDWGMFVFIHTWHMAGIRERGNASEEVKLFLARTRDCRLKRACYLAYWSGYHSISWEDCQTLLGVKLLPNGRVACVEHAPTESELQVGPLPPPQKEAHTAAARSATQSARASQRHSSPSAG